MILLHSVDRFLLLFLFFFPVNLISSEDKILLVSSARDTTAMIGCW